MPGLFEIANTGTAEGFIFSIPESLGMLVFAIALVTTAVLMRKLMSRDQSEKRDGKATKKA